MRQRTSSTVAVITVGVMLVTALTAILERPPTPMPASSVLLLLAGGGAIGGLLHLARTPSVALVAGVALVAILVAASSLGTDGVVGRLAGVAYGWLAAGALLIRGVTLARSIRPSSRSEASGREPAGRP